MKRMALIIITELAFIGILAVYTYQPLDINVISCNNYTYTWHISDPYKGRVLVHGCPAIPVASPATILKEAAPYYALLALLVITPLTIAYAVRRGFQSRHRVM